MVAVNILKILYKETYYIFNVIDVQSFVMRMNKSLWEFYLESWDTVSKTRQLLGQIIKLQQTNRMINTFITYLQPVYRQVTRDN